MLSNQSSPQIILIIFLQLLAFLSIRYMCQQFCRTRFGTDKRRFVFYAAGTKKINFNPEIQRYPCPQQKGKILCTLRFTELSEK